MDLYKRSSYRPTMPTDKFQQGESPLMIFGYLDPVTGSALVQVALGALAALGLGWQYVRKGSRDLLARFRGETAEPVAVVDSGLVETDNKLG